MGTWAMQVREYRAIITTTYNLGVHFQVALAWCRFGVGRLEDLLTHVDFEFGLWNTNHPKYQAIFFGGPSNYLSLILTPLALQSSFGWFFPVQSGNPLVSCIHVNHSFCACYQLNPPLVHLLSIWICRSRMTRLSWYTQILGCLGSV